MTLKHRKAFENKIANNNDSLQNTNCRKKAQRVCVCKNETERKRVGRKRKRGKDRKG